MKKARLSSKTPDQLSDSPVVGFSTSPNRMEPQIKTGEFDHLYQEILQSTSDGILAVNPENVVIFTNERFAEMWKIPPELLALKDDALLIQYVLDQLTDPTGFSNKVSELYHSVEESFDTLQFKDGRVFERLSRPMFHGKQLWGRVWSFRDISARRQVEEQLATSEAELRALFAGMMDVVIVYNTDGRYIKIAPTNPAYLYRPSESMLGKTVHDILPKEQADYIVAKIRESLHLGHVVTGEYALKIGDKTVWFSATASPLSKNDVVWVAHDITNRKLAEEALRIAESNYHSIFENATVGIYQSSPKGNFINVNPVMARIFGYDTPQDMLKCSDSIEEQFYVNPADYKIFQRLMTQHGELREFITEYRRKDGRQIWVNENARAVRDTKGNILYYEGFLTDITESRNAMNELRQIKDALESANFELKRSLERETQLASKDGLTGLYNRRYFFDLAVHEFQVSIRHRSPLTLLMFDLDNFKRINDTFGHATGDKLIADLAKAAAREMRASDVFARYGGDEFIALLPHTSTQQALLVAERIRTSVAAMHVEEGKESSPVTLSIGIAEIQFVPMDDTVEQIIKRADDALFQAKRNGRNCIVIYGEDKT